MALTKRSTPGVYLTEIDQSQSLQPVGTSTGGIVIRSTKGVANKPVLVQSEKDLVNLFGKPVFTSGCETLTPALTSIAGVPDTGYGFYAAQQFLQESSNLYVARILDSSDKYSALYFKTSGYDYSTSTSAVASTSANGISVVPFVNGAQFDTDTNISSIETNPNFGNFDLLISSLAPGSEGSNIAISLETYSSACSWLYTYDGFPTSGSVSAGTQTIAQKVCRIDVYTKDNSQSWSSIVANIATKQAAQATSASTLQQLYPPVETFYGTLTSQLDGNNRQLRLTDVVNGSSQYIYVKIGAGASFLTTQSTAANRAIMKSFDLIALGGGNASIKCGLGDSAGDIANVQSAWDMFASRDKLPNVNILICADWNTTIKQKVATIAATRQDCIAVGQVGTPDNITVSSVLNAEAYGYSNPSYMSLYAGYDKIYDKYNNRFFFVPKAIFAATIMARTDRISNTWMPPAGSNRGIIPSYAQLATYDSLEVGQLYDRNINTSMTQVGIGAYLMGQKTAQMKASALDRINVRRCLLFIENNIRPLLTQFLFELNTTSTRSRVQTILDNFLANVLAAGGVTAYSVDCSDTTNPPSVIDANTLVVAINVQPSKSIEFIELQVTIQSTGVSVTEA